MGEDVFQMPLNMPISLYILLVLLLFFSVVTDLKLRRILNVVTLPTLAIALLLHTMDGGVEGLIFGVKGMGLGFICFIIPYFIGAIGAGDVKLMSAVGTVVGIDHTLSAMLFIVLAGGGVAVVLLVRRRALRQSLSRTWMFFMNFVTMRDSSILKYGKDELSQEGMPFAVAIAAGVFLYSIYVWRTTGMLPVLGPV